MAALWGAKPAILAAKILLVLGLIYLLLRWFEYRQVFQPTRRFDASPEILGRPWENVELVAADGVRLHGWFFPADPTSTNRHLALLHCHGNGGNISHRLPAADQWLQAGLNVLLLDYRGYGQSAGRPSEAGTYLDAQAACQWLVQRGFSHDRVIALGESLGGGVVTELARREPLGGLVLQSTFTSLTDAGAELFPWLPVRLLSRIRYPSRERLAGLSLPVLVLHSRQDTLIPFHHGERLFAAAREPKLLGEIAGDHNDAFDADRGEYLRAVRAFLELRARWSAQQDKAAEGHGRSSNLPAP